MCVCINLHLAFICVFVWVCYSWPDVLFILSAYVISVLAMVIEFCCLVSAVLLCRYWYLFYVPWCPCCHSVCLHYTYFVGLVIVFIFTLISDCAMCLWPIYFSVDSYCNLVGINVCFLRAWFLLTSLLCLHLMPYNDPHCNCKVVVFCCLLAEFLLLACWIVS